MSDLAAAIAAGPGAAPSSDKYLGVPNEYTIRNRQRPNADATARPSANASGPYLNNTGFDPNATWFPTKDENGAGRYYNENDVFSIAVGRSPDEIADMQQSLSESGLIKKGDKFRIGVWDETTASAYRKALSFANQQGLTSTEALDQLASQPLTEYGDSNPLQYKLPDRNDVKAVAGKVSRNVLGRGLDDTEKEAFAAAYEEKLMQIQQQNYQNAAIEGAKLYEAPDQQTFIEQQIRDKNPNEAGAHDYANSYAAFNDLISSSAASARSGL